STMKMITCYIPPTSGSITVCGYDVQKHAFEIKREVGYLPEHNPLYLDMYVHEYLNFAAALSGLRRDTISARVKEVIQIVGLSLEQNKKIGNLSKGYRQRVGLAQAIIHDPSVLILDEPTSGLDPNQIIEIRTLIKELGKEKTVILSTHIMQEVQALCSHVVIINKGKIVADSTVEELKKSLHVNAKLIVEFNCMVDVEKIQTLKGVAAVRDTGEGKYEIEYLPETDIRPSLFHLASDHGWTLLGMKTHEQTMEDIFRTLTVNN
ncbi:MAG: ATP-binding cassette domain-containing protein, partial [Candidatus Pacearchaeota archaeon]